MVVRIVPARVPAPIIGRSGWRLVRESHWAQAVARHWPGICLELVNTINGDLRWAQLYRGGIELGMAAAEKRQALLDTGRVDAPAA